MLVSALYSLADRIFIGRGTGVDGIAAATAAFPFMIIGLAVGLLFSIGARSVASVALGAGRPGEARAAISGAVGASFLATAAAGIAIWIFADPLLDLFGAGARIAGGAKTFLGWMLLGLPFQSAAMAVASSLHVQGRPRSGFVVNLAGNLLNVGLDWLFIFGFGWGLVGAASATAASQAFSLALALAVVQGRSSELKIESARILPEPALLGRIAAIGAPVFLVNIVSTAILVVANRAITPYGGDMALAVIGVVNTIGMVVSYPLYGITNGAQPLFGYNYGAREWRRLGRLSVLVAAWTLAMAAAAEFIAVFRPEALIGLFGTDAALVSMGARGLRVFMLAFVTFPISQLPCIYFQSTKRPAPAAALMLTRSVVMIVGMLLLPLRFGLDGVYLAGPASDIAAAAIGAFMLVKMTAEIRAGMRTDSAAKRDVSAAERMPA
jgi:putative MATE family efflux protein